jgi:hypothetical protein
MAVNWRRVLLGKADAWEIPTAEVVALSALITAAQAALAKVQSSERTTVSTAVCKMAFDALVEKMRFIKRKYFFVPPLTDEDLAALGLSPADLVISLKKTPINLAGVEVIRYAPHILTVRVFTASVIDPMETGYGIRLFYGLVPPGVLPSGERPTASYLATDTHILSCPPLTAEDLPDGFFTRRKTVLVHLPLLASGLVCYLAGRYEIEKGPTATLGPMVKAFVP